VDAAERYADLLITKEQLAAVRVARTTARAVEVTTGWMTRAAEVAAAWAAEPGAEAARVATEAARAAAKAAGEAEPWAETEAEEAAEAAAQAGLLREIVGNPWRPLALAIGTNPHAHAEVLAIARRAYDERDFVALPILADALEEAGCTEQALLDHLRRPGPHVRGCVALDAILGRS
jgi:hypothetical protein